MKKNLLQYKKIVKRKYLSLIKIGINLFFVLFLFVSCNFDYPEEDSGNFYSSDLDLHFETGTTLGTINLLFTDVGDVKYSVMVYPKWIDVKKFEGLLDNGFCSIPFEFKNINNFISDGRVYGYVYVKVNGKDVYRISVTYGEPVDNQQNGQVPLYCSTSEIDFGLDDTRSFTIANQGQVGKAWYINNIPSWLELSQTSGNLLAGSSLEINCTVNRNGLVPGDYSQIIQIESNNPQLSTGILIEMTVEGTTPPENSSAVKWIEGIVQDACYCKTTDYLYVLTKSPNNLLVKKPENDSLMVYPLDKIPNCIDVSVNGDTIVIGYNQAIVDIVDARTVETLGSYSTDCVPYDLVLGGNGWCYLAPDEDQWVHLYSLDLSSGITYRTNSGSAIYEKSVLKKMPEQPYLYITRPQLSPSGLLIVNIENGQANDTIPGWHEDMGSMIWFSPDGSKIFAGDKEIHRTPEYTPETYNLDLPKIGTIEIPRNFIRSLDYNKNLECYFVVGSDYWWDAENSATVYQVDETSYSAERSLKVSSYPGYLGNQANPSMNIHFVYSNSKGTKLYTVKNVDRNLENDKWALEISSLPL